MSEVNERMTVTNTVDKSGEILSLLRNPEVDFNRQSEKYWGCLFSKQPNGKTRVMAASSYYCILIEDINASFREKYFDFYDNVWKSESTYPVSEEQLMQVSHIMDGRETGEVIIAHNNLINWLGQFSRPVLQKSRVIVSPGFLNKNEIVLIFNQGQGRKESKLEKFGTFCVSADSRIPEEFINIAVPYKCVLQDKKDGYYTVNVLEPFGKVRFGLKMSPTVFDPADMEKHVKLEDIVTPETRRFGVMPHNSIVSTSAIQSPTPNWAPIPTHIDASMLAALVKIFCLSENKLIKIKFGDSPNAPIVLENLEGKEGEPHIKIVLATLNPEFGMQMR